MLPWMIAITLMASICSAGMGAAWMLGVRRLRALCGVSVVIGLATGGMLSWWGGGSSGQIIEGMTYGAAIGVAVWVLLWLGVRPYLREIQADRASRERDQ